MSLSVLPMFSSKSFKVSGLTFRSSIHFGFIFVYGVRTCSNFILLHVPVLYLQHHLLKSVSFPTVYSCFFCHRLGGHGCLGLSLDFLSCSIQLSYSVVSYSLQPQRWQYTRLPCPSPTPGAHSNSCPLSRWCHPAISSSVVPFFSCLQSFTASQSFLRSQFFT